MASRLRSGVVPIALSLLMAAAPAALNATTGEAEYVSEGEASYYGAEFAGSRTASGERFDPKGLTAAHRTLPLGSKVRVTNRQNGRSVIVRINDRGPSTRHRVLDMSYGAAQALNMVRAGKAKVLIELLPGN